ncbi:MAG: NifB/NifX family molybdenum-iron cluster-binding protein [Deltaproteobacteria bacterium]
MKIAFASEDNQGLKGSLSAHFGRCPYYTIVDIEDNTASNVEVIDNPYFDSHVPGAVPQFIKEQNAQVMIAGGMGPRALEHFNHFGIEAITTGMQGNLEDILNAYLRGEISGATGCEHHH